MPISVEDFSSINHLIDERDAANGHAAEPQQAKAVAKGVEPAPESPEPQTIAPISKEELWQRCQAIATLPRILDRFAEDFRISGVVGEDRTAKLIYLAVTSRWFERPASIAVKGPSSGGKSGSEQECEGVG